MVIACATESFGVEPGDYDIAFINQGWGSATLEGGFAVAARMPGRRRSP